MPQGGPLPWENFLSTNVPWSTGTLAPHTVAIYRPYQTVNAGINSYAGFTQENGTLIVDGLTATIQIYRQGGMSPGKLPGDTYMPIFKVFIGNLLNGVVQERDFIVDETGKRYQVMGVEFEVLATQIWAQLMEL